MLNNLKVKELREVCKGVGIKNYSNMKKIEMIQKIESFKLQELENILREKQDNKLDSLLHDYILTEAEKNIEKTVKEDIEKAVKKDSSLKQLANEIIDVINLNYNKLSRYVKNIKYKIYLLNEHELNNLKNIIDNDLKNYEMKIKNRRQYKNYIINKLKPGHIVLIKNLYNGELSYTQFKCTEVKKDSQDNIVKIYGINFKGKHFIIDNIGKVAYIKFNRFKNWPKWCGQSEINRKKQ